MKIIEIEYTPNPNAVKFILAEALTPMGTHGEFHSKEEAAEVPLARALFEIDHVISVYYTSTWLTVTQDGGANWHELMREIAAPIREAEPEDASLGDAFLTNLGVGDADDMEGVGLDDERVPRIRAILEDEVMPFLQGDGGGLEIKGLVDNQLLIRYQGACGTCPSASMGTLMAIENLVQMEVDPEISVVSV